MKRSSPKPKSNNSHFFIEKEKQKNREKIGSHLSGKMRARCASHAGSWYDSNPNRLRDQLEQHLEKTQYKGKAKALIVPHAGYAYR